MPDQFAGWEQLGCAGAAAVFVWRYDRFAKKRRVADDEVVRAAMEVLDCSFPDFNSIGPGSAADIVLGARCGGAVDFHGIYLHVFVSLRQHESDYAGARSDIEGALYAGGVRPGAEQHGVCAERVCDALLSDFKFFELER